MELPVPCEYVGKGYSVLFFYFYLVSVTRTLVVSEYGKVEKQKTKKRLILLVNVS